MTTEEVASVLREYGAALRGDWGNIDGRSEQFTINEFADAFLEPSKYTAEKLRSSADICPEGEGHWTDYCDDRCGESE